MNSKAISIAILIIMSIMPADAAFVQFSPVGRDYSCPCGGETLVTAAIQGKASEFGNYVTGSGYHYSIRMVEVDSFFSGDDGIVIINGIFNASRNILNDNTPVVFSIIFELKCSDDCNTVTSDGIKSFIIMVNGTIENPIRHIEDSNTVPLLRRGEYHISNLRDDGDGRDKVLAVEISNSNTNIPGSANFHCISTTL